MVTSGASTFTLYPAIDLRDGRVVRLEEGAFDHERVYGDDPAATADSFRAAGAHWLHVVDLDAARTGRPGQQDVVRAIVERVTGESANAIAVRVQLAGGLRDAEAVAAALAVGASRAVLGTTALRSPDILRGLIDDHGPERIAVALDVRDGLAVGDGWVAGGTGAPLAESLAAVVDAGARTLIVTSIARDGLLGGPDLDLLASVLDATDGVAGVIASGGIASMDDVRAVRDLGCAGAVIGRALYDGRIDLAVALEVVSPEGSSSSAG